MLLEGAYCVGEHFVARHCLFAYLFISRFHIYCFVCFSQNCLHISFFLSILFAFVTQTPIGAVKAPKGVQISP